MHLHARLTYPTRASRLGISHFEQIFTRIHPLTICYADKLDMLVGIALFSLVPRPWSTTLPACSPRSTQLRPPRLNLLSNTFTFSQTAWLSPSSRIAKFVPCLISMRRWTAVLAVSPTTPSADQMRGRAESLVPVQRVGQLSLLTFAVHMHDATVLVSSCLVNEPARLQYRAVH